MPARPNWNDHKTDTVWFLDPRIAKLSGVRKTLFGIARTGLNIYDAGKSIKDLKKLYDCDRV